jgi:hypothetical protein
MGIFKSIWRSKPTSEELTFEVVEAILSADEERFRVRIKKGGRELYAEDLFRDAKKPKDLLFSRFFLLNESPPKPHFAPSLNEAVDWFTGKGQPKDGYGTIFWGKTALCECSVCRARREVPMRITRVERLRVTTVIPVPREIDGYRVVEVETELTGRGFPTRRLEDHKLKAILSWYDVPNQYLCRPCADKLAAAGRPADPAEYFVFEVK